MDSIVATTLRFVMSLYRAFLLQLLCWFEMHRFCYLMWKAVLGGPVTSV
jgi:hypothetical protein